MDETEVLDASGIIDLGLLKSHIYVIDENISGKLAGDVIRWLIYENLGTKNKTLTLFINSPGGELEDAFAISDIMRMSKFPVSTVGLGSVQSAAFLIFASGFQGERYIAKNSSILCHQFSEEFDGARKYHDLKASLAENENRNNRMIDLLVETTGLSRDKVKEVFLPASDVWLTAEDLIRYGAADHVF